MDGDRKNGSWTILLLFLGLPAIAACVILPQLDSNHRLDYERQKLVADLDQINRQIAINEQFLGRLESDPQLAQRLAQRQMRFVRQGESLLPYKGRGSQEQISPYSLVQLPPPAPLPAYVPPGGKAGIWLLDSHNRLYCLAAGLFLAAAGLVLSSHDTKSPGLSD